MSEMSPKVSVVMPVYNGAQYLRPAIESILGQTFTDFDFIIVDDGSTDKTPEILRSYDDRRIRVISQDNQGLGASANRGIRASSAEYIARFDADDLAAPDRLDKQVGFLDQNPDYVLVGGFMEVITADGQQIYLETLPTSAEEVKQSLRAGMNPFFHSSIMFRRRIVIEVGLYDELYWGMEQFMYNKLLLAGHMANLPICMGKYRITPGALTNQPRKVLVKRYKILKKTDQDRLTDEERQFLGKVVLEKDIAIDKSVYALRVGKAYLQHTNDLTSARSYLWQAVKAWTFNWPAWYNLFFSYFQPRLRPWKK